MTGSDFSLKTRSSTRIPMRISVRLGIQTEGTSVRSVDAWTLVLNRHGARIECKHPPDLNQEVLLTVSATEMSSKGKVVWREPNPNQSGNYEFAVELLKPENLWGVEFPPTDWTSQRRAASEEAVEPEVIPMSGQSDALEASPEPQAVHEEAVAQLAGGEPIAVTAPYLDSTAELSQAQPPPPNLELGEELLPTEEAMVAAKPGPAFPEIPASKHPPPSAPQSSSPPPGASTVERGQSDASNRLVESLNDLVESALEARMQTVRERMQNEMLERFEEMADQLAATLERRSEQILTDSVARRDHRQLETGNRVAQSFLQRTVPEHSTITGRVKLPTAAKHPQVVLLSTSDSHKASVPETVTIEAGASEAEFPVRVFHAHPGPVEARISARYRGLL